MKGPVHVGQFRPQGTKAEQRTLSNCTSFDGVLYYGVKAKEGEPKMSLSTYKNNMRKHMIENGMFDIFMYRAADGTKYDLFKNHSRVTVAQLQQYWETIIVDPAQCDQYVRENLKWSGEYIMKTISQPFL